MSLVLLMLCDCETCRRVRAYLERPSMTGRPTQADRYVHAKHLIRDNPPPPPIERKPAS